MCGGVEPSVEAGAGFLTQLDENAAAVVRIARARTRQPCSVISSMLRSAFVDGTLTAMQRLETQTVLPS